MRLSFIALYLATYLMFVIVPTYTSKTIKKKLFRSHIAPQSQYLWLVHQYDKCAGSLIDPYWILTTAHCQWSTGDILYFYHSTGETSEIKTATVTEVIRHPDFDFKFTTKQFDIALVRLKKAIDHTKAIRILQPEENIFLKPGTFLQVVGWESLHERGDSHNELMITNIPIISNTVCGDLNHYGQLEERIFDSNICAGFDKGGHDACIGNLGSPLLLELHHELVIVGIMSWGIECDNPHRPRVYTRVSSFRDWIYDTMNKKNIDDNTKVSHISSPWPSAPLSCIDECGNPMVSLNGMDHCACDVNCAIANDCCSDYYEVCAHHQDFIPAKLKFTLPVLKTKPKLQESKMERSENNALSCSGNCGLWTGTCYCDSACVYTNDCCDDVFEAGCVTDFSHSSLTLNPHSCVGSCGFWTGHCYCDESCYMQGDCCVDMVDVCLHYINHPQNHHHNHHVKVIDEHISLKTLYSCHGYCGTGIGNCFCDNGCIEQGDCCEDYYEMCAPQTQVRQQPLTLGRVPGAHHNSNTNDIMPSVKSLYGNGLSVSQDPESSSVGTINIPWPDSSLGRSTLDRSKNKDEKKSFNSGPTGGDTSQIIHAWPVSTSKIKP